MTKQPTLIDGYDILCEFEDPTLCAVYTLSEAALVWGKSQTAIRHHMITGAIKCRKPVTGGDWLLSRHSLVAKFGEPEKDVVCLQLK